MLAATNSPIRSGSAFLDAVRRSGLLKDKQVERGAAGGSASADGAAMRFVSLGLLTAFQAKRLLAGKSDGFFLGPYVMLEPLGERAGGKVYRARHRTMNRAVAIKLLTPERTRSAKLRDAFESATKAAVQLLHPNIVTTFDANRCGDRMYAVLEYVPGQNLGSLIRSGGSLPVEYACEIARQVALALQHAHGVVHGLLNPDNVLVGEADSQSGPTVKVLNFGYGRLAALYANDATNQLDGAMAVADYLAPELFDPANAASPASDLFSLGCILHALLAGRTPVGDRPVHQFALRHGVERWRPGLSTELAQLVRDLLNQSPADRPKSAGAVAARLAALGTNRGTTELALPAVAPTDAPNDSPFADFDRETLNDLAVNATLESPAVPVRRAARREARSWTGAGAYLLAAFVIVATGLAVGLVVRSAVR